MESVTTWLPSSSIVLPIHPIATQPVCILMGASKWPSLHIFSALCIFFCKCNASNVMIEYYKRQESAPPSSLCCYRDKAPGQRECDYSIDSINKCIRDIEQASLAAVGQSLPCRVDISLEVIKCISLLLSMDELFY